MSGENWLLYRRAGSLSFLGASLAVVALMLAAPPALADGMRSGGDDDGDECACSWIIDQINAVNDEIDTLQHRIQIHRGLLLVFQQQQADTPMGHDDYPAIILNIEYQLNAILNLSNRIQDARRRLSDLYDEYMACMESFDLDECYEQMLWSDD